jgi:hypothetical protein
MWAEVLRMAGVLLALVALVGCGSNTITRLHSAPKLLAEAHGICPTSEIYSSRHPECRTAHAWNATTPNFRTPRRGWGVAYAFNCGAHAGDFSFVERLPGMDHMAVGGPFRHARSGSGFIMISGKTMLDLLKTIPPQFEVDGELMAVNIASACTWHVKAILGARQDVSAAVPPVPAMKKRWWT